MPIYITLLIFTAGCNREAGTEPTDDLLPPSPPSGLFAYYASDGAVGIEWAANPEPDISGYYIYRAENGSKFILLDSTSNLYFIDAPLDYETEYSYKLSAFDHSGKSSTLSNGISVIPRNRYTPHPPRSLVISALNRSDTYSIELSWEPGNEYDISGYKIYRSDIEDFTADSSTYYDFSPDYFYEDSGELELLTTYYYQVTRLDLGGLESEPSGETGDFILDKPANIFPVNQQRLDYFTNFRIQSCSMDAAYKIIISESELLTDFQEISFNVETPSTIVDVPVENISLSAYRKYYWQVLAYTNNKTIPNSYSEKFYFIIEPGTNE